jgi:hypothetical protein
MKSIAIILFLLLTTFSFRLYAQDTEKSKSTTADQSFVRLRIRYISDYVFMGRTDSLKAPYITPSLGYYHSSGVFLNTSFSYLTSADKNRIDLYKISGGYDNIWKNVSAGGSLSGYFFNSSSYTVQSAMVGFLNGYIGYDFNLFEIYADGSLGLSDEWDGFAGIEFARTSYVFKNHLRITPSVYINAGTQNYSNEYYTTRSSKISLGDGYNKGMGKGVSNGGQVGSVSTGTTTQVRVEETNKFQILDYEFSIDFTYRYEQLAISVTPVYALPINPSTITLDQTVTFEEPLENVFYWYISVSYRF